MIKLMKIGGSCTKESLDVLDTILAKGSENNLVVISAMGKTTQMIDQIIKVKNKKKLFNDLMMFFC